MRYRVAPSTVEAEQWTGTPESWEAVLALKGDKHVHRHGTEIVLTTWDRYVRVQLGEYVIKSAGGAFSALPCAAFAAAGFVAEPVEVPEGVPC